MGAREKAGSTGRGGGAQCAAGRGASVRRGHMDENYKWAERADMDDEDEGGRGCSGESGGNLRAAAWSKVARAARAAGESARATRCRRRRGPSLRLNSLCPIAEQGCRQHDMRSRRRPYKQLADTPPFRPRPLAFSSTILRPRRHPIVRPAGLRTSRTASRERPEAKARFGSVRRPVVSAPADSGSE
jgi:hypothetical protein